MRENFLFHRKHRAVAGNKGPAIPSMTNIKRELLQQKLRARLSNRHGVVTFQLRRRHRFSCELSEGSFPTFSVHACFLIVAENLKYFWPAFPSQPRFRRGTL